MSIDISKLNAVVTVLESSLAAKAVDVESTKKQLLDAGVVAVPRHQRFRQGDDSVAWYAGRVLDIVQYKPEYVADSAGYMLSLRLLINARMKNT